MENKRIKVAVIGATGAVGQVFMWMLSSHPWFELTYATASAARVGQRYADTVHWVMPFEMPESIKDMTVKEFNYSKMKEAGVKISEKNPIHLELPYPSNDEEYTQKAQVYKTSVEEALGKKVILDLVACASYDEWYYTGYYTEMGYESNYDIFDLSGWGPDYGDPQTYLDTFLGDYAGYMAKCCGIF